MENRNEQLAQEAAALLEWCLDKNNRAFDNWQHWDRFTERAFGRFARRSAVVLFSS